MGAMARKRSAAKWLGCLFIAGMIALPSLEVGLRLRLMFNDDHVFDEHGLFSYAPHRQVGPSPAYITNNLGFFGPDLTEQKDAATFRVIVLGSSAVASPLLAEALTSALEARMPGRQIEVNTAGIPRYTSYHNALLVNRYIRPYAPDCYVYYEGINDNVYNTFPGLDEKPYDGFYDPYTWNHSVLADMVWYQAVTKRIGVERHFTELRSPARVRAHLAAIVEMATADGARVVLMPMAAAWPADDEPLAAAIAAAEGPMSHFWGATDAALSGLAANNAVLAELAQDGPAAYCPAALSLVHSSAVFRDLCHFTEEGIGALAEAMAECIADGI